MCERVSSVGVSPSILCQNSCDQLHLLAKCRLKRTNLYSIQNGLIQKEDVGTYKTAHLLPDTCLIKPIFKIPGENSGRQQLKSQLSVLDERNRDNPFENITDSDVEDAVDDLNIVDASDDENDIDIEI